MITVGGHPITDVESTDPLAHFQHRADIAVTQRYRLVQFGLDGLNGGHQAVGANLVQHHFYLVGLLSGLIDPVGLAEVLQHALGAGGDDGAGCTDQQGAGFGGGGWRFDDLSNAGMEILEDLFHKRD